MSTLMLLCGAAAIFFVAHVVLLFTSFGKYAYSRKKYFWSHATLWITGILLFFAAYLFAGTGENEVIDVFNTPMKQYLILIVAAGLSLVAHTVVKLAVMPKYNRL